MPSIPPRLLAAGAISGLVVTLEVELSFCSHAVISHKK